MPALPEVPRDEIFQDLLKQFSAAGQQARAAAEAARQLASSMAQFQARWANYTARCYGQGAAVPYSFAQGFNEEGPDLSIGSLFGVRQFRIAGSPFWDDMGVPCAQLWGVRGAWSPGENRATCLEVHAVQVRRADFHYSYRPHSFEEIPHADCGCGFWAYWSEWNAHAIGSPDALGVVEGWGGYRTGERGFRCSKAQLIALHVYPQGRGEDWTTMAEQALAETYKVPVYSAVATMLKAHPTSRPQPEPDRSGSGATGAGYAAGGYVKSRTFAPPVQFANFPTNVPCMGCHAVMATSVTKSIGSPPMFHCDHCPPKVCSCAQHYFQPAQDTWATVCHCGTTVVMPMGAFFTCRCGTVHAAPMAPGQPPSQAPLTPISALGILDAKAKGP